VLESARARAAALQERAEEERQRHSSVDAVFEMVDRDGEVGGGLISAALAYRFFIWLLPLALVAVAGLGIAAHKSEETPQEAAGSIGLAGLVSSSVAAAASGPGRWYALIIGIPALVYATSTLLRGLLGAHRLVWGDARDVRWRVTPAATLRLLALLLAFPVAAGVVSAIRASTSPGPGIVAAIVSIAAYVVVWFTATLYFPHRTASWKALLPGALLVGAGFWVLHAIAAYLLAPYAIAKQGTYGVFGAAAALLFGLYLLSRVIVFAAVVDATLWERSHRDH